MDRRIGELSRVKDHFEKFVPETVKKLVAENPDDLSLAGKWERDVSVLFLDISGYIRLSEQFPAAELNALVEHYFSTFLDHTHEAGGDINEMAGDGFMALFYAEERRLHTVKAVDVALVLRAATEALNRENSEHPLPMHMGINSGTALVGSTRFEGLRGTRWTFTASGPVTNLAARLAGTAREGQILVGPETVEHLGERFQLDGRGGGDARRSGAD